jgi:hypothetical protein
VRFLLATMVLVAGCGFEHGELAGEQPDAGGYGGGGGGGGGSGSSGATPTPTPTPASMCRYPDASLRLCLEFDDGALSPVVHDSSGSLLDADASGLSPVMRSTSPADPAAAVEPTTSSLAVKESDLLDIKDNITLEMWIRPYYDQSASLIRNEGQYVLMMDGSGNVGCSMAGKQVFSTSLTSHLLPYVWSHIACSYDGKDVRVFLNGRSADCAGTESKIATSGDLGTRIAPNFRGDIDGVRIYATALSPSDICTHAGQTSCQAQCNGG